MGWFDYRKFKTNNQGGYFYAMQLYYRNVLAAIDALIAAGIIPIVIGTGWRNEKAKYYGTQTQVADKDLPKHFVTSFNAVSRGIAEFYQIPYYNLQLSHDKIENFGLELHTAHGNDAQIADHQKALLLFQNGTTSDFERIASQIDFSVIRNALTEALVSGSTYPQAVQQLTKTITSSMKRTLRRLV